MNRIFSYIIFLAPLISFFYIDWYWVILLYNILCAVSGLEMWMKTNNPKMSLLKAVTIPLIFNLIGAIYVMLKISPDSPLNKTEDSVQSEKIDNEQKQDDIRDILKLIVEKKLKVKVTIEEEFIGNWQLKEGEEVPLNANESSYDFDPEEPHGESGCVGIPLDYIEKNKIYDNTYFHQGVAWYNEMKIIHIIKKYISEIKDENNPYYNEYNWSSFSKWFWSGEVDDMNVPDTLLNQDDFELISYNIGYPSGKNNISWNSIYELTELNQNIELI